MTGGIDSTVAAFLLRKRGFQCIGVSIVFLAEEEIKKSIEKRRTEAKAVENKYGRVKSKVKYVPDGDTKFLEGNCSVKNLENVRKICTHLNMPFYAVNALEEFNHYIFDPLVASKISGEFNLPCANCNNLKIDILLRKAKLLNADFVATGHYAKIYKIEKDESFHLANSNDQENDQSYLLSRLEQYHLARLIFPLADLRRNEVFKIVEKFHLPTQTLRDSNRPCFISTGLLGPFIESRVGEKIRPIGPIIEKTNGLQLGEHYGIYHFKVGQKLVEDKLNKTHQVNIEKDLTVIELDSLGRVYMGEESVLESSGCGINQVNFPFHMDQGLPIALYVKTEISEERLAGMLTFKNNNTCIVEFNKKVSNLKKGQLLTFYNKNTAGAKVIGSGIIYFVGDMDLLNRTKDLDREIRDEDGEVIKVTLSPLRF